MASYQINQCFKPYLLRNSKSQQSEININARFKHVTFMYADIILKTRGSVTVTRIWALNERLGFG